jgi:hypothetical protein
MFSQKKKKSCIRMLFTKHAAQMSFITSTSHTQKKFEKMLEGA